MTATERVVVLMTPEQKAEAQALAADAQVGLGEYMRRQTFREAGDGDEALLRALVEELNASTVRASAALDAALAKLDLVHADMATVEARARERAQAEFAQIDPHALATLVGEGQMA